MYIMNITVLFIEYITDILYISYGLLRFLFILVTFTDKLPFPVYPSAKLKIIGISIKTKHHTPVIDSCHYSFSNIHPYIYTYSDSKFNYKIN